MTAKRIVLIVVAFALVIGVSSAVHLSRSAFGNVKAANSEADSFLIALQKHDYNSAYSMMTPQTQENAPPNALQGLQQMMEKRYGLITKQPDTTNWFINYYKNITTIRFIYTISFQKHPIPLYIVMMKGQGIWRVQAFHYMQLTSDSK